MLLVDDGERLDDSSSDVDADIPTYAGHPDALSDALCVGENFVVVNVSSDENEGKDFYIIKCKM